MSKCLILCYLDSTGMDSQQHVLRDAGQQLPARQRDPWTLFDDGGEGQHILGSIMLHDVETLHHAASALGTFETFIIHVTTFMPNIIYMT